MSRQILVSAAFALTALLAAAPSMAIEEPKHTVLETVGPIQIRQYEPALMAEVEVAGERSEAINKGFRILANFIFGNNRVQQKIAMTAPVTQVAEPTSTKIAMTAPVTMEPQSQKIAMTAPVALIPAEKIGASQQWRVHFVMPSQYNINTIPKPKNPDVKLREVAGKLFAVHSFTGFNTESRVQTKTDELSGWIGQKNLKALGPAQLARYDPPWTLPMFRRNEVMVEVEDTKTQP